MSRRVYDDDDGRTIADMSDLSIRTPLGYYCTGKRRNARAERKDDAQQAGSGNVPENGSMSREARRSAVSGALVASLLIALAFIAAFGIFIALICLIFR